MCRAGRLEMAAGVDHGDRAVGKGEMGVTGDHRKRRVMRSMPAMSPKAVKFVDALALAPVGMVF
jgi:hypothetical protein